MAADCRKPAVFWAVLAPLEIPGHRKVDWRHMSGSQPPVTKGNLLCASRVSGVCPCANRRDMWLL